MKTAPLSIVLNWRDMMFALGHDCAAECERFASGDAMKQCARTCRACARVCREFARARHDRFP
jgi:hypothetical protein